ncbi:hypothetical protein Aph01nite_13010 [Acrocarpospora phusangensis]|uniref:Uncharacterized protein n=1 Tax=Acrocarpospora phusangensis TaxID=1070424 RepID=A0A919Q6D6_9ACTN|nr:hypothetical protein [Acrocarpospora phusangensis]GIH22991.1 hypothetical protein Aph01nite_13010 [Acrocarpospora phusangensis]
MSEPMPVQPALRALPRPEDGEQDVTQDPTDVFESEVDDGEESE